MQRVQASSNFEIDWNYFHEKIKPPLVRAAIITSVSLIAFANFQIDHIAFRIIQGSALVFPYLVRKSNYSIFKTAVLAQLIIPSGCLLNISLNLLKNIVERAVSIDGDITCESINFGSLTYESVMIISAAACLVGLLVYMYDSEKKASLFVLSSEHEQKLKSLHKFLFDLPATDLRKTILECMTYLYIILVLNPFVNIFISKYIIRLFENYIIKEQIGYMLTPILHTFNAFQGLINFSYFSHLEIVPLNSLNSLQETYGLDSPQLLHAQERCRNIISYFSEIVDEPLIVFNFLRAIQEEAVPIWFSIDVYSHFFKTENMNKKLFSTFYSKMNEWYLKHKEMPELRNNVVAWTQEDALKFNHQSKILQENLFFCKFLQRLTPDVYTIDLKLISNEDFFQIIQPSFSIVEGQKTLNYASLVNSYCQSVFKAFLSYSDLYITISEDNFLKKSEVKIKELRVLVDEVIELKLSNQPAPADQIEQIRKQFHLLRKQTPKLRTTLSHINKEIISLGKFNIESPGFLALREKSKAAYELIIKVNNETLNQGTKENPSLIDLIQKMNNYYQAELDLENDENSPLMILALQHGFTAGDIAYMEEFLELNANKVDKLFTICGLNSDAKISKIFLSIEKSKESLSNEIRQLEILNEDNIKRIGQKHHLKDHEILRICNLSEHGDAQVRVIFLEDIIKGEKRLLLCEHVLSKQHLLNDDEQI